jgi:predicted transposase/invertase (TIGR01784 family)
LDYLKCSDVEKREYEKFKESLHDQASMYESTYVVGHMDGVKKGKIEGIEEGKQAEKVEIAKKMLQRKTDIEMIIEFTGLTKGEIEFICKQLTTNQE